MGIPTSARIGYGLMNQFVYVCVAHIYTNVIYSSTWKPTNTADEDAFAAIKAAVDNGCTMLNSAEFYETPDPESGLKLLSRFYEANPDYVDKTYLSVKGGMKNMKPDSTYEGLLQSVTNINKLLGGKKKMDLFQPGRRDRNLSTEDIMKNLLRLRDEGHYNGIC